MWKSWGRPSTPTLAIIAPLKEEAASLLEWIAYHRAQGIDTFILGDNGGDDGTSELLAKLQHCGVARVLNWRGKKAFQLAFCDQARAVAQSICDGTFIVDADEFLRPTIEGVSVGELARAWLADSRIGAVAINWAIYGSSGREEPCRGLVIERFTRRAEQDYHVNRHVTSFVRVKNWKGMPGNPHSVTLTRGRYVTTAGERVVWHLGLVTTAKVAWDKLRIDHFVVKSRAEFEAKKARGNVIIADEAEERERMRDFFAVHDRNDVLDPMPVALIEKTKAELARLEALLASTAAPAGLVA
jgi:hypothetical protein